MVQVSLRTFSGCKVIAPGSGTLPTISSGILWNSRTKSSGANKELARIASTHPRLTRKLLLYVAMETRDFQH